MLVAASGTFDHRRRIQRQGPLELPPHIVARLCRRCPTSLRAHVGPHAEHEAAAGIEGSAHIVSCALEVAEECKPLPWPATDVADAQHPLGRAAVSRPCDALHGRAPRAIMWVLNMCVAKASFDLHEGGGCLGAAHLAAHHKHAMPQAAKVLPQDHRNGCSNARSQSKVAKRGCVH